MAGHIKQRRWCTQKACRATIPQSKDGRWARCCPKCGARGFNSRWRARHPDPSRGGTAQLERTFATRREAEEWLDELKHSARSGKFIDPRSKQTFAYVADEWRATWGEHKPSTKAGYDALLEKHVLPRWGKAKVNAIMADRIQEWVNQDLALTPTGRQRAPNTVRNIYNVLREVLALAQRRRYIASNPCDAVKLPTKAKPTLGREDRSKRKRLRTLAPGQIKLLAEAVPEHYRTAVYVAAHTGLRAGELWALRREDIDLLRGTISVDETLQEIHSKSEHLTDDEKGMVFGPPKSEAGDREFALPEVTLRLLKEHLTRPLPGGTDPEALIFTTPTGKPVRHNLFYSRVYKPAVAKAGLPRALTFHDLRHTCASLTLSVSGGNFYLVKERLGHADIQTTVNTYGHMVPHADEALAASLSKLFEAAAETEDAANVREFQAAEGGR